jgi:hypothetical protein
MEGFFCCTSIREARPEDRQRDGGLGSGEGEPQRGAQGTRGTNFNWTRDMVARDGIEPPTAGPLQGRGLNHSAVRKARAARISIGQEIWWPGTGSNRRRRPFQGYLPIMASGLE